MSLEVRRPWFAVGALGALAVAVAHTGVPTASDASRVGQVVFVPGELADARGAPEVGRVTVAHCQETPDGLLVRGSVEPSEHVTAVLVAPGDPLAAGLAVSASFATSAGRTEGAHPGDFLVTLSWASRASRFAVVGTDWPDGGVGAPVMGPAASCPEGKAADGVRQPPAEGAVSSTQSPS